MAFTQPNVVRRAAPVVQPSVTVTQGNGLPASFYRDGFGTPADLTLRPRLMIGTDGPSESGKTEFAMSAPGPGIVICLDRGYDACLMNARPPAARRKDFAFKPISVPMATQSNDTKFYLEYWRAFYAEYKKALENPDARTVCLDGDSDSWELQRLAAFGKLTQIPSIMYTDVNAARRAMIARAWDTGKIIIATNKVKDEYVEELDAAGNPILDNSGKPKRKKSGELERQGFSDTDYLWQIQLRHFYVEPPDGVGLGKYGIRILKCKKDRTLVGMELTGEDCNFAGLVQTVYPEIPLENWGF